MSTINDAMKQAQRERDARRQDSGPALLGETFFPPTTRVVAERHGPLTRTLVYVGIGCLVVASVVGTAVITYRRIKSNPPAVARSEPAGVPSTSIVAPVAVVTPPPAAKVSTPDSARTRVGSTTSPRTVPAPPRPTSHAIDVAPKHVVASAEPSPIPSRRIPVRGSSATPLATNPPAPTRTPSTLPVAPPAAAPQPSASLPSQPRTTNDDMRVIVDPTVLRSGDSLFARAFAEHTRGNLDGAADLYERALSKPPVAPELYNDYGALLATRGKHAAAIAMYNLGIAANDKDSRLWANLGDSYRAIGRRADAMSAYFEAAKLDPANIAVKVRLAAEYASLGDTASARRGFDEAVRSAPNDPEAHYRYGAFLQAQHDTRGAIRELQAFLDLAPGKYPADIVDRTRAFVTTLRRQTP